MRRAEFLWLPRRGEQLPSQGQLTNTQTLAARYRILDLLSAQQQQQQLWEQQQQQQSPPQELSAAAALPKSAAADSEWMPSSGLKYHLIRCLLSDLQRKSLFFPSHAAASGLPCGSSPRPLSLQKLKAQESAEGRLRLSPFPGDNSKAARLCRPQHAPPQSCSKPLSHQHACSKPHPRPRACSETNSHACSGAAELAGEETAVASRAFRWFRAQSLPLEIQHLGSDSAIASLCPLHCLFIDLTDNPDQFFLDLQHLSLSWCVQQQQRRGGASTDEQPNVAESEADRRQN
ncbi:hypothetical protein Efla_007358 [Eimeria flavescens]